MEDLWDGITLPEWGAETSGELLALWHQYRVGTLNRFQDDRFSRLLMALIRIRFRTQGWGNSLPRAALDPGDVAQDLLMHARRKLKNLDLKHRDQSSVLIDNLNQCWDWKVLDEIKKRKTRMMPSTNGADSEESDRDFDEAPAKQDEYDPEEASRKLYGLLRDAMPVVLSGIRCRKPAPGALYEALCKDIISGEGLRPHAQLPPQLKGSREVHALITSRLVGIVSRRPLA